MASVFCEHGKVKTTCPTCKPQPAAKPLPPAAPTGRAPGVQAEARDDDEAPEARGARGPGKPLMPTRKRPRRVSAEDMDNAEAWFVKKG